MDIQISDLEKVIDKEYFETDIIEINAEGIVLKNCAYTYDECVESFCYSSETGIGSRKYIGARNSLTTPPYIKFYAGGEHIFICFSCGDALYDCMEKIRGFGYDAFDLSQTIEAILPIVDASEVILPT